MGGCLGGRLDLFRVVAREVEGFEEAVRSCCGRVHRIELVFVLS